MNIKVVGIDLAKNVFQICVLGDDNSVIKNRKVSRDKLLHEVRQFPPNTLIAMEACLSSNYWGETIQNMGYQVKLLPAQHVKPMARRQKMMLMMRWLSAKLLFVPISMLCQSRRGSSGISRRFALYAVP